MSEPDLRTQIKEMLVKNLMLQTTADRSEGVRAFLDKRKPLFKGA